MEWNLHNYEFYFFVGEGLAAVEPLGLAEGTAAGA
jgi:hypothetical protein